VGDVEVNFNGAALSTLPERRYRPVAPDVIIEDDRPLPEEDLEAAYDAVRKEARATVEGTSRWRQTSSAEQSNPFE
jgi:hypothetical protein